MTRSYNRGSAHAKKLRKKVRERDGDYCFYCSLRMLFDFPEGVKRTKFSATLEHLLEVSQGGRDVLTNLVLAHGHCNVEVQGMNVEQKYAYRIRKTRRLERKLARGLRPHWFQLLEGKPYAKSAELPLT